MTAKEYGWEQVASHARRLTGAHLRELFSEDPDRFNALSLEACGILADFSKEKIDRPAVEALLSLAETMDLASAREALFSGEKVNRTEGRAVLHMALRDGAGNRVLVDGQDVMPAVHAERARMLSFAEAVRSGAAQAVDGGAFTHVVNIGIGGSDLGPAMAATALAPWCDGPDVRFVSNVDGADLHDTLARLDPRRTLVLIASKTFTTMETMMNARTARCWLEQALGPDAGRHLAALSTNLEATAAFGIDDDRVFGFWDWVGGRYSVWSSIGLPLAIAIGAAQFKAFLSGAREMDQHFATAPIARNLPALLALIGVWRRNAMGWPALAVIPYDQRLRRFPAFLQQLEMESNGKSVGLDEQPLNRATAPVVFGEPGTNAQHSFFQLLHQGSDVVPVDFLLAARGTNSDPDHHHALIASALAQSAALAFGDANPDLHRHFPGDRPSTTLVYDRLDPHTLGALIALYEHKIFVQGMLWGINSFDQFGVELGKRLTKEVLPLLEGNHSDDIDASTKGLVARITSAR